MEIKVTIEAPGLEGALYTLAQVLANYEMPVKDRECEVKKPAASAPAAKKPTEPAKEEPKQPEPAKEEPKPAAAEKVKGPPPVSLETVRAKLADLAREGKQAQIKALFGEYGAAKLTEVPEDKFPELLEKAAGL